MPKYLIFIQGDDNITIFLFTLLIICVVCYSAFGLYVYRIDKKGNINSDFFAVCISTSIWAIGYAFMLISQDINVANLWRLISALGWCAFPSLWILFTLSLKNPNQKNTNLKMRALIFTPSIIFFISNLVHPPSKVLAKEYYGWIDIYPYTSIDQIYSLYMLIFLITGLVLIFSCGKNSKKNRIKMQMKIIFRAVLISFVLGATTDLILPIIGVEIFPTAIITISIGLGGIWYAISKHRMLLITTEFVSEYIFKAVNEPIFILGEDFLVKDCNKASLQVTGYSYKELEGKALGELIKDRNFNIDNLMEEGNVNNIEVDLQRENNNSIACELSGTIIYDEYNDILGVVILLHDISERKNIEEIQKRYSLELENKITERTSKLKEANVILKNEVRDRLVAEEKLLHLAYYDPLTDLPNRKKIMEVFSNLIAYKNEKFAVLFMDLDNFKNINDNFGHQAGDSILKGVAIRLNNVIGPNNTISRIGGDEFIIIVRNLKCTEEVEKIAAAIGTTLRTAFVYKENDLYVGTSIGISIFPEHGTDVNTLIKNADLAMYESKENGGYGYKIYSKSMDNKSIDKLSMKIKLNNAISNNEFITYYQPLIDLKSMEVLSSEALIRWKQRDKIIPPIEFIPIAKSIGELVAIDNWMLKNACIQCKKWQDLGKKDFSISVNTSYKQLKQVNFIELVASILKDTSLSARYLNIEITEDEAMEDPELIINILTKLKALGIKISLDDFGTGYSSLSYVNMLPIDTIKIDRSLILNLANDRKSILIIKSIIGMAHSLNIKVVAEGIETEEQFNMLKEIQCDLIQGYLIGKPMDATLFQEKFID